MLVSVAVGAPVSALPEAVAPIAPDPFVPDVSTFEKLITVMDAAAACARVAVTVTLVNAVGANARQISLGPSCTFVRLTSCQVRPVAGDAWSPYLRQGHRRR